MESSSSPGYTEEEKYCIAKKYLIPKQIFENGIKDKQIEFTDDGVKSRHLALHARSRPS